MDWKHLGPRGDARGARFLSSSTLAPFPVPSWRGTIILMDKKAKKKIQTLNQRVQKLQQQLAGARKQVDDPAELKTLEAQLSAAEAELAKLKSGD